MFLNIVIEVKASGPPHVFNHCDRGESNGMLPTKPFLCQSNFMEIIRLLQRCCKCGHSVF